MCANRMMCDCVCDRKIKTDIVDFKATLTHLITLLLGYDSVLRPLLKKINKYTQFQEYTYNRMVHVRTTKIIKIYSEKEIINLHISTRSLLVLEL